MIASIYVLVRAFYDIVFLIFYHCFRIIDFTRLKLVQGKKEDDMPDDSKKSDQKDNDITAQFDAQDDEDVVF